MSSQTTFCPDTKNLIRQQNKKIVPSAHQPLQSSVLLSIDVFVSALVVGMYSRTLVDCSLVHHTVGNNLFRAVWRARLGRLLRLEVLTLVVP